MPQAARQISNGNCNHQPEMGKRKQVTRKGNVREMIQVISGDIRETS